MNDDLLKALTTSFDEGAAPGGTVTLLAAGQEAASFSYGSLSGPGSPSVTADTVYDVASVTKLFTTALILQLHDRGKLSISDRCGTYLPNFQHSQVRIMDLMSHRLGAHISMSTQAAQHKTAEELRTSLLSFEPPVHATSKVIYGNIEFFYLGAIIEQVTDTNIQAAMRRLIDSLDLRSTYTGPDIAEQHILAAPTEVIGENNIQGMTHDESARALGGIIGHAGIFSTANDLAMFGNAWLTGAIAQQRLITELAFKDYDPAGDSPQALGWWLRLKLPDDTSMPTPGVYSHNGFTGSFLVICPGTSKAAALTCNRTYYGRQNTRQRHIWQLLTEWVSS